MRHRVVKKTLGRKNGPRKALMRMLTEELIKHEKIETTLTKAKVLRPQVEHLVTKAAKASAKQDKVLTFNTFKELKKVIESDEIAKKLMSDIGPRFTDTKGGYTRITKTRNRDGDNSMMAKIEFVKKATEKKPAKAKETKEVKVKKETQNEK